MGEERLTGLAMLNVHRDISVSGDKIIDRFAKSNKTLSYRSETGRQQCISLYLSYFLSL